MGGRMRACDRSSRMNRQRPLLGEDGLGDARLALARAEPVAASTFVGRVPGRAERSRLPHVGPEDVFTDVGSHAMTLPGGQISARLLCASCCSVDSALDAQIIAVHLAEAGTHVSLVRVRRRSAGAGRHRTFRLQRAGRQWRGSARDRRGPSTRFIFVSGPLGDHAAVDLLLRPQGSPGAAGTEPFARRARGVGQA